MWGPVLDLVESNGFPFWFYSVTGEKWLPEYVAERRLDLVVSAMERWDEDIDDRYAYFEEVRAGQRMLRHSVDYGIELSERYDHARPAWANRRKIEWLEGQRDRLTIDTGFHWELRHVVPVDGRNVCGLHVHENLEIVKRGLREGEEILMSKADYL